MSTYLDELNSIQREAVTQIEGPVLVVAGPGSGKTRVLTYRIAHIIESGIAPWEILSLTFTNKAALSMKNRIAEVVGNKGNRVWSGTFHSIFARLLRVESERIGFPSNFTIYDTDDSKSLLRTIVKELNLSKDLYPEGAMLGRISSAKTNLITPVLYAQNAELIKQDNVSKRPYVHKIYAEYTNRCKRAGAMDFDDLLYRTYELLQHEDILDKYRARFRYFLVDEFQDTNFLQYAILKKLVKYPTSPQNICVVGDDAQSIYAFRGATIDNIFDYQKDFAAVKIFKLEQNYRSTQHIVDAANEVIMYNKRQIQKTIWTEKIDGQRIQLVKTQSDQEEAKRVADLILEHKNRYHLKNSDFAILYRTNAQSRPFEESLRRINIPYRVYGGMSFYQRKEVKDVLAYLRLITNLNDDEAFRRIINLPRRGIGDSTIEKLSLEASTKNVSLWHAIPTYQGTPRERTALESFKLLIEATLQRAKKGTAYEVAVYIAKQSGLIDSLKMDTTLEGIGKLENANALLDAIKEFVENDEVIDEAISPDKSLSTYLQNVTLVSELPTENGENPEVVTLMSVHSAKGLEFKSVIVGGMEEDLFPSFMSKDAPEGLDEERRLFYVAITRAEQFLTLTYATSRYRHGQMKFAESSRFIDEISSTHMDGVSTMLGSRGASAASTSVVQRARVGGLPLRSPQKLLMPTIDEKDFIPSPPDKIKLGNKILHLRFGKGEVLSVEGGRDNLIAGIRFDGSPDVKKIALKFAKLQIMD